MTLIEGSKRAWKLFSVQLGAVAVAFGLLPEDQQAAVLDLVGLNYSRVPAVLGLLFIASRLIAQPGALDNDGGKQ